MNPEQDERTVMTLDAGGTNFVFSAIRSNKEIAEPVLLPSNAHDLQKCISTLINGFQQLQKQLPTTPSAISFGLPGPIEPISGVVGKLTNLPAFSGGVVLGPILENEFNLPVFINNDANLFAYGEAISGFLPEINESLEKAGVKKHFKNLVGITLGTGFGAGIVRNKELFLGDNSMSGEVWLLRNRKNPYTNAEEGISIRAIKRVYGQLCGLKEDEIPEPKEIFDIASGKTFGNIDVAKEAFHQLGIVLGDALGNILTLIDGVAVIGGGISGAMSLIMPSLMAEISSNYKSYSGSSYPRLDQKIYDYRNEKDKKAFLNWPEQEIKVPGTNEIINYSGDARIPIGISRLGTSRAIAMGAYAFALTKSGKAR